MNYYEWYQSRRRECPEEIKEEIISEMRSRWGHDYPEMDMYIASFPQSRRIEKRWGHKIKSEYEKREDGSREAVMIILTPHGLCRALIRDGFPDFESMRTIPDKEYSRYYDSTMNRLVAFDPSELRNKRRQSKPASTYQQEMPQRLVY